VVEAVAVDQVPRVSVRAPAAVQARSAAVAPGPAAKEVLGVVVGPPVAAVLGLRLGVRAGRCPKQLLKAGGGLLGEVLAGVLADGALLARRGQQSHGSIMKPFCTPHADVLAPIHQTSTAP